MTATPGLPPSPAATAPEPLRSAPADATPELLRSVFRRHAAGVAVITAAGESPVGFTATSLTSVAAEPPLISFGVGTASSSWPVLAEAEHVGVHILGEHQRELAATFARSGADRFGPSTQWTVGPRGVPLLDDVSAWLVCRVVSRIPAGDHRVVIAEAVAGDFSGAARPLVYHEGRFTSLRD
ncbi:flavin reductase family protein [Streptomyces pratensis]|uniref:flavin reductase family protein n=1 Tax=Streptomyces pratensis TaxID=1169025 RepID=UPI003019ECEE